MEAFYNKKDLFYKILYEDKISGLNENSTISKKRLLLSPVSGIIKKIDNNGEVIIKTCDGYTVFIYLTNDFLKGSIVSFVKEGELIFKGDTIFDINNGYENTDLIILKVKS